MKNVTDLFLNLISYDTQSDENSESYPSTKSQLDFMKTVLLNKCIEIGLSDVAVDEHSYLFATLPSNIEENVPTVGFIAHVDTSPEYSGKNIFPKIEKNYSGGDIKLSDTKTLSPTEFPILKNYIGNDIITTDGSTLLGADDKAGVAEIITAMEYLINNPSIKHGKIRIAFTPDEEIGQGVNFFDVKKFGAQFAYTLDGGQIGEFECQSFNAASASISIEGKSVHPGSAKDIMVNASLLAAELTAMFPKNETPATTEGLEGFYHLTSITGDASNAKLEYIIRDFDRENFNKRKDFVETIVNEMNLKYKENPVSLTLKDQYYNMYEILGREENQILQSIALEAMKAADVTPIVTAIRGGTDGSRLSFMNLPCPNIFAGGHNFHGPYEFIPVQSMIKAVEVIMKICEIIPQKF